MDRITELSGLFKKTKTETKDMKLGEEASGDGGVSLGEVTGRSKG